MRSTPGEITEVPLAPANRLLVMTMAKRILLVEDDDAIGRLVSDNLLNNGFSVQWSHTGPDGLEQSKTFVPDLVVLDLMLSGDLDGFELCQRLGSQSVGWKSDHIPIITLTAHGRHADGVRGLNAGADDFLEKPPVPDELLARIWAVLRRTKRTKSPTRRLSLGETVVDFQMMRASRRTEELVLTKREIEVLRCLAERPGSVVTRQELLSRAWGHSDLPRLRRVDNLIFKLRRKIERDPHHPTYIRTAYSDGYCLTTRG